MEYKTIEKSFYADSSSNRFDNANKLYEARFNSESTYRTGIELETGELFLTVPRELINKTQ